MYAFKFVLAIVFSILSFFLAIFPIKKLSQFPCLRFSEKGNYGRIAFYSSMSAISDVFMTGIVIWFCGEGEFGTGYELLISLCTVIFYAPWCILCSQKLKKRMNAWKKINVKYINSLNYSIFFKAIFALFVTIFFVEGNR